MARTSWPAGPRRGRRTRAGTPGGGRVERQADVDARDVHGRGLEGVDLGERRGEIGRGERGDDVARAGVVRRVGHVAVAEARRLRQPRRPIAKHARAVSRAGAPSRTVPAACMTRAGRRSERSRSPSARRARTRRRRRSDSAACGRCRGRRVDVDRDRVRRPRPSVPATADRPVPGSVPSTWPAAPSLYVEVTSASASGLSIDVEDVGVLEEQRARADAVERVAEAPHLVAVDVGDRAERGARDVAGRVAGRERRARLQRLAAGSVPSGPAGRGEDVAAAVAAARAGALRRARARARRPRAAPRAASRPRAAAPSGGPRAAAGRPAWPRIACDRRGERHVAAVRADRVRDRADRPRRARGVGAEDRRAREARADARGVDRRAGGAEEDRGAPVRARRRRRRRRRRRTSDVGPADDGERGAVHPRVDVGERHDRAAGAGRGGRREQDDDRQEECAVHAGAGLYRRVARRSCREMPAGSAHGT